MKNKAIIFMAYYSGKLKISLAIDPDLFVIG